MNKVAHFIIHNKAATYIAALMYIAVWSILSIYDEGGNLWSILYLLLTLIIGHLSVRVAQEFSLGKTKNSLPATLYFMGCTIAPQTTPLNDKGAHLLLFSITCYILLHTYRNRSAMGDYFLAFVLIGIQCLMAPPLLLVLPWLILCGAFMESLHIRTFFASLWGILCPYWIVCCILFLTDRIEIIGLYTERILPTTSGLSPVLSVPQLREQLLWALLLTLPGSIVTLLDHTMKLQSSSGFRLLILAIIVLFCVVWTSPELCSAFLPCILLCASLIANSLFKEDGGRARNTYLIVLLVLWFTSLSLHVWNSFMTH